MKAKILTSVYHDYTDQQVIRIYLEKDFEQAQKDLDMLKNFGNDNKSYSLTDCEIYGEK